MSLVQKQSLWQLHSGAAHLLLVPDAAGRIRLNLRLLKGGRESETVVGQSEPLAVEIVTKDGNSTWLTGSYTQVTVEKATLCASGTLTTQSGSRFRLTDTYRVSRLAHTFEVDRQVIVESVGGQDVAFGSRFCLAPTQAAALSECEFLAPGIWYGDNKHVPPAALAADTSARYFYFREDRLPLPFVMQRHKRSGLTVSLGHLDPKGGTFAGEDGLARIVDERLQFGSLGVLNDARVEPTGAPQLAFLFPGSEGERTYIYGPKPENNRWALRSHPVRAGFSHGYRLAFALQQTESFPAAVRATWRAFYDLAEVPLLPVNLSKVYRDGMAVLKHYAHEYNGVPAVPFFVRLPDGKSIDTSSQMGFVGQALPVAFLLLKQGLEAKDEEAIGNATKIVDFWVQNAMSGSGVVRTWYDFPANTPKGTVHWRPYPTYLRVASDGLNGALGAWELLKRHGRSKPEWLAFCRRYGEWLVKVQNPDGSFFRAYGHDGAVVDSSKDTSVQPIRFLVDLHKLTGAAIFKTAALRAGEFCLRTIHDAYAYVGGTPDNPNVLDKEAGLMALESFLALHDLTGEQRWLSAAVQAADFSETWTYCWNVPMPAGAKELVFPRHRTTHGLSLIATGHSGADSFMAAAPFLYYRLSLLTGDTHYRDLARMLLFNTKQLLDWDGSIGYGLPGLQSEALGLAPVRGAGVNLWLPWLTTTSIEPLMRLRDVFGDFDIKDIEKLPPAERLRRNEQFGRTRGFAIKAEGG